ncbi:MAG: CBS domain-containing protein [Pseudomonadota bacterium]
MTESAPITVHDVMTPQPAMIDGLATVREAVEIMREKKFSSLIIKKRDVDDEYGMVSMPEIARQVIEPDLSIDRTSVYQVMVKPVLSVDGHMNIRYAIRLLSRYGETRALVLEQGIAVGIVTLRDMVFRYIEDRL